MLPIEDIGDIIRKRVYATPTRCLDFTLKATQETVTVGNINNKRRGWQLVYKDKVVLSNVLADEIAAWMVNRKKRSFNGYQNQ